jgi:hypothetical protein
MKAGDIVECWPGGRPGRSYMARIISDGIVPFGGTDCYRVQKLNRATDYLAVTHVELTGRVEDGTAYVKSGRDALAVCDFDLKDVVIEDNAERIKFGRIMKALR